MHDAPAQPFRKLPVVAAVLCLVLSAAAAISAAEKKSPAGSQKGRSLYAQHCVSCHGVTGAGDGPAASALKVSPADLTRLGKKYNGFPTEKVMDWIDGTKYAIGHGSREMPVWGKRFARDPANKTPNEVQDLTAFLQSIQKQK